MTNYLNACIATEGKDGKTYFTKVGVAFYGKEGSKAKFNIKLDAIPTNGELILFEPRTGETAEVVED